MLCEVVVKLSVGAIFSTHHDDKQHVGNASVGVVQTAFGNVQYLFAVIEENVRSDPHLFPVLCVCVSVYHEIREISDY